MFLFVHTYKEAATATAADGNESHPLPPRLHPSADDGHRSFVCPPITARNQVTFAKAVFGWRSIRTQNPSYPSDL